MKKNFLAAALLFLAVLGPAFGKTKLLHAETKYFDIIFEETSKDSAREICNCADSVLEKLCLQYKVEPNFRIPVVITPGTEQFNAYFTNYNYNHIVLYDSIPQESMLVFSETIKSTFVHELTHLVSINSKNGFWKGFGKIFGDIYNPGDYLTMPSFFKEGASVWQESKNGEGRLNCGFFLHDLKQAKLSGKFPGYTDSFGSRTIYPYGSASYIFGSAFTEYIIEKYGMDKYAEYWHRGINGRHLTSTGAFKKTYGISMRKEWKAFYNSIDVSGIEKDPASLDGIKKSKFSSKGLHLYSVAGLKSEGDIIWDKTTDSVFCGSKKLFTKKDLLSAKTSLNGKYITATFLDPNHTEQKTRGGIFNTKSRSWKILEDTGVRQLCVFEKDGKEYAVIAKSISQKSFLEVRGMDQLDSKICSVEYQADEIPNSLSADSNGNIWFLLKEGLKFSICRATLIDGEIKISHFALDGIVPQQISVSDNAVGNPTILFSHVRGKSFPRLAMAEPKGNELELHLLQKDISGGILSPVMKGGKILYAAKFYTEGAVYELDPEVFKNEGLFSSTVIKEDSARKETASVNAVTTGDDFSFTEYKKFLYSKQTIIPLSILKSYYISPSVYYTDEEDCLGQSSYSYLLGLTVLKNNPWDTRHIGFTAGYSPAKKAGGAGLILMGKTPNGILSANDMANVLFDKDGFMQANNSLTFTLELLAGNVSHLYLSETNILLYGKNDMDKKKADKYLLSDEQINKNYLYNKNIISLSYSTMHKYGARTHESSGIRIGVNYKNVLATTDAEKEESIFDGISFYKNDGLHFAQLYPSAEIALPGILPIDCKGPFIYNLPVKLGGSLFQFNDTFANLSAEAIVFSWDVQKGFGPVPLYIGALALKAFYQEEYVTGLNRNMEIRYLQEDFRNMKYMGKNRYAGGSLVFDLGGNTGVLASSDLKINLACKAVYCFEGSHKKEMRFLVTSALNFSLF